MQWQVHQSGGTKAFGLLRKIVAGCDADGTFSESGSREVSPVPPKQSLDGTPRFLIGWFDYAPDEGNYRQCSRGIFCGQYRAGS
jgi:hypothetical protein